MIKKTKRDWLFEEKVIVPLMGVTVALLLFYVSFTDGASNAIKIVCLGVYLMGTVTSVSLGHGLKQIAQTPEEAIRLNNSVHKWSVVALNGSAGIGCLVYLVSHLSEALVPTIILGSFFALYFLSWALRIIRPHSLLARYRSVLLRVVLTTVIAGIMWNDCFWLVPLLSIPALIVSWRHLRRDQAKFGWAFR